MDIGSRFGKYLLNKAQVPQVTQSCLYFHVKSQSHFEPLRLQKTWDRLSEPWEAAVNDSQFSHWRGTQHLAQGISALQCEDYLFKGKETKKPTENSTMNEHVCFQNWEGHERFLANK